MVLGPEPLVVDDAGRERVGVPVAERQHAPLDRRPQVGCHLGAVALPQRDQVEQVEVARVLERVDLVEGGLEVRGVDGREVEPEPGSRSARVAWARTLVTSLRLSSSVANRR